MKIAGVPAAGMNDNSLYVPINYNGGYGDSPLYTLDPSAGYFGWPGIGTRVGEYVVPPMNVDQSNIAPYLPTYGLAIVNSQNIGTATYLGDYYQNNGGWRLMLQDFPEGSGQRLSARDSQGEHLVMDIVNHYYYFGYNQGYFPNPLYGVQIDGNNGTFSMNSGSSPYSPPFEYIASMGMIKMVDQFGGGWMGWSGGYATIDAPWGGFNVNVGGINLTSAYDLNLNISGSIVVSSGNSYTSGVTNYTMTDKALLITDDQYNTYLIPLYQP